MSRWIDHYKNHPVHEKLQRLNDALQKKPYSSIAEESVELRRLTKILKLIGERLKQADPELASPSLLDSIANGLEHPNSAPELEKYVLEGGASALETVNNHLTTLLPTIHSLSTTNFYYAATTAAKDTEAHFDGFVKLVDGQQQVLSEVVAGQTTKLEELKAESAKLQEALATLQRGFEQSSGQWQSQFTDDQTRRQTEHSSAQDNRQTEYSTWLSQFKNDANEDFKTTSATFGQSIDALIEDARAKHKVILELHELVAGDAVTASYLSDGKKERAAADFWRVITFVFIIATACWLGYSFAFPFIHKIDTGEPWIYLLKSASLTGVLMFGAAYASRQSKSHRDQERKARWFGLEVKAFEPFVSSLDEVQKKAMREKFADRMFGQKPDSVLEKDAMGDGDLVKTLLEIIAKSVPART